MHRYAINASMQIGLRGEGGGMVRSTGKPLCPEFRMVLIFRYLLIPYTVN